MVQLQGEHSTGSSTQQQQRSAMQRTYDLNVWWHSCNWRPCNWRPLSFSLVAKEDSDERPPHSGRFSDEMIQFTMYMISLLMTNGQKRTIKRAKRTGHEFKICKEMGIKKEYLPLFEIFLAETAQYSCYCSLAVSQCGTILTNFHQGRA